MVFDNTITIGNVITILVFMAGAVAAWYGLKNIVAILIFRVGNVETDVKDMREDIKTLGQIITQQAVQDQKILHLEQRIEMLSRGEGFVFPLSTNRHEVPTR